MRAFLILLLCSVASAGFAQAPDSITMKKVFGGYQFIYQGKNQTFTKLKEVLKANEAAYQEFKSAEGAYTGAIILSFAGGALIGWPIGTAAAGGDANWALAGAGAALILVAIPITHSFNVKARKAVNIYNTPFRTGMSVRPPEWKVGVTPHGVGLTLKF